MTPAEQKAKSDAELAPPRRKKKAAKSKVERELDSLPAPPGILPAECVFIPPEMMLPPPAVDVLTQQIHLGDTAEYFNMRAHDALSDEEFDDFLGSGRSRLRTAFYGRNTFPCFQNPRR